MKDSTSEILALAEKAADSGFQMSTLGILGFPIPESLNSLGVTGVALSAVKIFSSIRDQQFVNAFQKFTNELEDLTPEQKINFYDRYPQKNIQDFGEQAVLLLNKIEMPLAASLMGRAHRLLVLGDIDSGKYFNYCHVIKNINQYMYENLLAAYRDSNKKIFSGGIFSLMESLGLMFEIQDNLYPSELVDENNPQPKVVRYMKSDFGEEFYQKIIEPYI